MCKPVKEDRQYEKHTNSTFATSPLSIVALAIYLICAMAEGSTTETVSLNLILTGLDSGVAQVHTWYGDIPDRRAQI